jgi:UDP-glucose:(heptosyl)LPS alpha-1,3-glucosyltransferase
VLFVGSGFRRKGLERLLRLWRDGSASDLHLLVVGNDARLAQYRSAWSKHPRVHFAGPRTNVEEFYAAGDLLALPSVQEAFGNAVLEGLAAGLPIITVDGVGALDKVTGELRAGILQDPDDPAELQRKMFWLLDAARWPELSRQARDMAERYTWKDYIQKFEALLFDLRDQGASERSAARVAVPTLSGPHRSR